MAEQQYAETYFIHPEYTCRLKPIKDGFWTDSRIAREPHNGSYWVMEYVSKAATIENKKILDIGCGPSSKIRTFFPNSHITGLDMPEAIELARKNNPVGIYLPCDLDSDSDIQAVSRDLQFFDVILCIDVIEHVLYPEKMLRLIRQHMSAESVAFISTLERDISRGRDSGHTGSPHPAHIREWNQAEFTAFIESEGFAVSEVKLTPLNAVDPHNTMKVQTLRCKIL